MTDCPITFPAVAFSPGEPGSNLTEGLGSLENWAELAEGSREEALERLTWEIIDSVGARWRITESPIVKPRKGLMGPSKTYFILAPKFECLPKLPLAEFKARACAAIRSNPDYFANDEVVAGEANEPVEVGELLEARCRRVQEARTNAKVIAAINAASEDFDVVKPFSTAEQARRDKERNAGCLWGLGAVASFAVLVLCIPLLPAAAEGLAYTVVACMPGVLLAALGIYFKVKAWDERRRNPHLFS